MRLIKALSGGNPDSSSAINRSGRRPIRVLNREGEPGLAAYEIDDNPASAIGSATEPLCIAAGADDVETLLDQQGYHLDPNEWYPG